MTGTYGVDVLMEHTDPDLVHVEMGIHWVHSAGQDPVAWLERSPARF